MKGLYLHSREGTRIIAKVIQLLEFGVELVVRRAEILPVLWCNLRLGPADVLLGSLCESNRKTSFQMPIDMAMVMVKSLYLPELGYRKAYQCKNQAPGLSLTGSELTVSNH